MTTGIIKLVHRADHPDGPFMTIGEVAEYFERSRDTIRRWCEKLSAELGEHFPSHKMPLNEKETSWVWCYTESDIRRLEKYSSNINPKGGRPPKNKENQK